MEIDKIKKLMTKHKDVKIIFSYKTDTFTYINIGALILLNNNCYLKVLKEYNIPDKTNFNIDNLIKINNLINKLNEYKKIFIDSYNKEDVFILKALLFDYIDTNNRVTVYRYTPNNNILINDSLDNVFKMYMESNNFTSNGSQFN